MEGWVVGQWDAAENRTTAFSFSLGLLFDFLGALE
jgi:hypothetical protein